MNVCKGERLWYIALVGVVRLIHRIAMKIKRNTNDGVAVSNWILCISYFGCYVDLIEIPRIMYTWRNGRGINSTVFKTDGNCIPFFFICMCIYIPRMAHQSEKASNENMEQWMVCMTLGVARAHATVYHTNNCIRMHKCIQMLMRCKSRVFRGLIVTLRFN